MNGSPELPSGYVICACHGTNCDGWHTGLGDSGLSGHAVIYENGGVQSIVSCSGIIPGIRAHLVGKNSFKVISLGSC